jgi:hypothetical protein
MVQGLAYQSKSYNTKFRICLNQTQVLNANPGTRDINRDGREKNCQFSVVPELRKVR